MKRMRVLQPMTKVIFIILIFMSLDVDLSYDNCIRCLHRMLFLRGQGIGVLRMETC